MYHVVLTVGQQLQEGASSFHLFTVPHGTPVQAAVVECLRVVSLFLNIEPKPFQAFSPFRIPQWRDNHTRLSAHHA